jgi:hypothetical protein
MDDSILPIYTLSPNTTLLHTAVAEDDAYHSLTAASLDMMPLLLALDAHTTRTRYTSIDLHAVSDNDAITMFRFTVRQIHDIIAAMATTNHHYWQSYDGTDIRCHVHLIATIGSPDSLIRSDGYVWYERVHSIPHYQQHAAGAECAIC